MTLNEQWENENEKNYKLVNLTAVPSRLILGVPRQWEIRKDKNRNKEYKAWENII